jgi:hypothetical protein
LDDAIEYQRQSIFCSILKKFTAWMPAFAGMTVGRMIKHKYLHITITENIVMPAKAGIQAVGSREKPL